MLAIYYHHDIIIHHGATARFFVVVIAAYWVYPYFVSYFPEIVIFLEISFVIDDKQKISKVEYIITNWGYHIPNWVYTYNRQLGISES